MVTAAFLVLGALTIIAVFGIGWARAYEGQLEAERLLDESEAERVAYKAFYDRHRAAFESGVRGSGAISASIDRSEFGRPRLVKGGES